MAKIYKGTPEQFMAQLEDRISELEGGYVESATDVMCEGEDTFGKQDLLGAIASKLESKGYFVDFEDTGNYLHMSVDVGNETYEYDYDWNDIITDYDEVNENIDAIVDGIVDAVMWNVEHPEEIESSVFEDEQSEEEEDPELYDNW